VIGIPARLGEAGSTYRNILENMDFREKALHQEIHEPIYRIDPSTYTCFAGVRCWEP
jgi:hypothetical protein